MSSFLNRPSFLPIAIITFVYAIGLGYFLSGGTQSFGSDELAYLAVAEAYANLDWMRALNGMRAVLPSILAAPIVAFVGIEDIALVRAPSYFFGLVLLWMVFVYAGTLSISPWRRLAIVLPLIPLVILFSLGTGSDMIAAAFALALLIAFGQGEYLKSDRAAIMYGLLFGFSLFAKTILFYLSISLLIFGFVYYFFFKSDSIARKLVVRRTIIALLIVGAIGSVWAGVLSNKYGYWTLGAAGRHNFYIDNQDWVEKGWYFPHKATTNVGLLELPHPQAASYIEDGTFVVDRLAPIYAWSPFESVRSFKWFVGMVRWRLERRVLRESAAQSPMTLGLIFAAGLLLFAGRRTPHFQANLFSLAALTIAMGAILSVNFKYLYLLGYLLSSLCIVSSYIFQLHDRKILAPFVGPVAVVVLAASFSVLDVKGMLQDRAAMAAHGKPLVQHAMEQRAAALKPHISGRRLASTTDFGFFEFSSLCLITRCGFLGNPKYGVPWAAQLQELHDFKVDYFATKPTTEICNEARAGLKLVERQPIHGVCLWQVLPTKIGG